MIVLTFGQRERCIQPDSKTRFAIGLIALFSLIVIFRIDIGFENARYFQMVGIGLSIIVSLMMLVKPRPRTIAFCAILPVLITYLSVLNVNQHGIGAGYSGPEFLTEPDDYHLMGFRQPTNPNIDWYAWRYRMQLMGFRQPLLEGIYLQLFKSLPTRPGTEWYTLRYSTLPASSQDDVSK